LIRGSETETALPQARSSKPSKQEMQLPSHHGSLQTFLNSIYSQIICFREQEIANMTDLAIMPYDEQQESSSSPQACQRPSFYPTARGCVILPSSLLYISKEDLWALPEGDDETSRSFMSSSTCSIENEEDLYEVPPLVRKVVEPNVNKDMPRHTTRRGRNITSRSAHLSLLNDLSCGMILPIVDCGGLIQEAVHKMKQKRAAARNNKKTRRSWCRPRKNLRQRLHAMS
jgi:hypothetical protein